MGIIQDLGPHLMDTIKFWFNKKLNFEKIFQNKFENRSPDHAILFSKKNKFIVKPKRKKNYCKKERSNMEFGA